MNTLNLVIVTLFFINFVSCGLFDVFKACPKPDTVPNFDANKYSGIWYEINRVPITFPWDFEKSLKCIKAEYGVIDENTISVTNSGINIKSGKPSVTTGRASNAKTDSKSKLIVSFSIWGGIFTSKGNYWVVDTDYTNYSFVYSCSKILGIFKTESAWFLSRTRNLDATTRSNLINKMESFSSGLSKKLLVTDQTNCTN